MTIGRKEIEDFICRDIAEYNSLKRKVMPEEKLTDLNLDSLDMVAISMEYEDKYGITLNDDDVSPWKTVNDIVTFIHVKVSHGKTD